MTSADRQLPTGTVTMLFTDVEGSTRLLDQLGPGRYAEALIVHRERVRAVALANRGVEMGTEGDAFFFVFQSASDGLAGAGEMQAALVDGPLRVRIGIHSGEVLLVDGDYVGMAVHKAARISSAAHGGQVVVSAQTRALADAPLRDLGEHRLKDLTAPERLYQLGDGEFPPLRTLRRGHLPLQPTPLIGRQRELAELMDLADTHRLITLTGTGGTGKTRLGLALAAELSDRYADGVWWVSLATVTNPELVLPAIATALGDIEDLPTYLRDRALLLVLDNLEQAIDAAASIAELLSGATGCAAVVTSRERLGVSGEQEYPVPPLSPHDAFQLFTARAREVKPGFEPGAELDAICERLDCLPLALELAATRVKVLSEHQLLTRLEQRLPLLAGGRRDAPERQGTMRAAIAWSYDLLTEPEQRLFTALAVFAGSLELEAAEEVCHADLDTLQSLIDKSLLRHGEEGEFFLLQTTREFALERLAADEGHGAVRERHARWYFRLGAVADSEAPEAAEARARLRGDAANVDLALQWALDNDIAAGLPLIDSMFMPWLGVGRIEELQAWYAQAVQEPGALEPLDRAAALAGLGQALGYTENLDPAQATLELDEARTALQESLAIYREAGDERGEARALLTFSGVEFVARSAEAVAEAALGWAEQALRICERIGDWRGTARALHYIGECLRDMGELDRAKDAYRRSIEIRRSRDLGGIGATVHSLADLSLDRGDLAAADDRYHEALAIGLPEGDVRLGAYCLAGLACVAVQRGELRDAGRLWTLVERIEQQVGFRMIPAERVRYERILSPPLTQSDEFLAGVADAADIDAMTAVAKILRN